MGEVSALSNVVFLGKGRVKGSSPNGSAIFLRVSGGSVREEHKHWLRGEGGIGKVGIAGPAEARTCYPSHREESRWFFTSAALYAKTWVLPMELVGSFCYHGPCLFPNGTSPCKFTKYRIPDAEITKGRRFHHLTFQAGRKLGLDHDMFNPHKRRRIFHLLFNGSIFYFFTFFVKKRRFDSYHRSIITGID